MEKKSYILDGLERRKKERINKQFHVKIYGKDSSGESFEKTTVVDNLSSSGFYIRLDREVEVGAGLKAIIRLTTNPDETAQVARISVEGTVVRTESLVDGTCGLAMMFTKHRFLN